MKQYRESEKYLNLLSKYNKLAKKADRRMRNLEKLAREPGFESVVKYAYARAFRDILQWSPEIYGPPKKGKFYMVEDMQGDQLMASRAPRWQRNTPMDTRSLKAKIKDIENFLAMKTSTKRGILGVYKKRVDAINSRYGTSFTWQELAEFFDSGMRDKTEKYGSKTVLYAIAKIQNSRDDIVEKFKQHQPVHLKIEGDEKVKQTVDALLRYYKKDLSKILN